MQELKEGDVIPAEYPFIFYSFSSFIVLFIPILVLLMDYLWCFIIFYTYKIESETERDQLSKLVSEETDRQQTGNAYPFAVPPLFFLLSFLF